MKIAAKQQSSFIKAPLSSGKVGALLYGPDYGKISQTKEDIIKNIISDPQDPFLNHHINLDELIAQPFMLVDSFNMPSMMGGTKVISVNIPHNNPGNIADKITIAVNHILQNSTSEADNHDAFFIITAGELPPKSALRKLFEKESKIAALALYNDERYDIVKLAQEKFQQNNIYCSKENLQYLASLLGSDYLVNLSEIEKIILYLTPGNNNDNNIELTIEDIDNVIMSSSSHSASMLFTALLGKKSAEMFQHFYKVLQEGEDLTSLIRKMLFAFTKLLTMAEDYSYNMNLSAIVNDKKYNIFYKEKAIYEQALRQWSVAGIMNAIKLLSELENNIRNSGYPDNVLSSQLLLKLAR